MWFSSLAQTSQPYKYYWGDEYYVVDTLTNKKTQIVHKFIKHKLANGSPPTRDGRVGERANALVNYKN
jgi:hypothetical protein